MLLRVTFLGFGFTCSLELSQNLDPALVLSRLRIRVFLAHSVLSVCSNSTLLYQLPFPDWEA